MKGILLSLMFLLCLGAASSAEAQTAENPDDYVLYQDWPSDCLGPDDPFCDSLDPAKKDCSKIVVTTPKTCYSKCKCQYDKDMAECYKLSGGAYKACYDTAQRVKDQCDTQCYIDFGQ